LTEHEVSVWKKKLPEVLFLPILVLATSGFGVRLWGDAESLGYFINRGLAVVVGVLVIIYFTSKGRTVKIDPLLVMFLGWSSISVVWSVDPTKSIFTLVAIAITWFSSNYFGAIPLIFIARSISNTLGAALALSLVYYVLFPEATSAVIYRFGLGYETLYVGLWGWNSEVAVASGVLIILSITLRNINSFSLTTSLFAIALVNLWLAESALAFIALAASLLFMFYLALKPQTVRFLFALTALLVILATVIGGLDGLVQVLPEYFGRDATFSGRTVIWDLYFAEWGKAPLLGYGVGVNFDLNPYLGWSSHAHNGFLSALFQLGLPGLVLVVAILTQTFIHNFFGMQNLKVALLIFIVVLNLGNDYVMAATFPLMIWALLSAQKPGLRFSSADIRPHKNRNYKEC
jgi:O-antigen ligase